MQPADFEQGPWPYYQLADEHCAGLPVDWPAALQPEIDEHTERLVGTRVQIFGRAQLRIHYATAFGEGTLRFDERGHGPLPGSNLRPLVFRKRLIQAVAGGGVLLAILYAWRYTAQHEWFSQFGYGGWILLLGLCAALAVAAATFERTLSKSVMRPRRLWVSTAVAGVCCLLIMLLSSLHKPSGARAEAALLSGDHARARLEAEALQTTERDLELSASVLDKLHLRELREANDLAERLRVAEAPWFTAGVQNRALDQVGQQTAELLEQAIRSHDIENIRAIHTLTLKRFPESHRRSAQHLAIDRAQQCLKSRDMECVYQETKQAETLGVAPAVLTPIKDGARALLNDEFAAAMRSVRTSKRSNELRNSLDVALKASQRLATLTGQASVPSQDELATKLQKITARIERASRRK